MPLQLVCDRFSYFKIKNHTHSYSLLYSVANESRVSFLFSRDFLSISSCKLRHNQYTVRFAPFFRAFHVSNHMKCVWISSSWFVWPFCGAYIILLIQFSTNNQERLDRAKWNASYANRIEYTLTNRFIHHKILFCWHARKIYAINAIQLRNVLM